MKDTLLKSNLTPPLPSKLKLGLKKEKMAAKKAKEHKTPIMKVGKTKKLSNINKKSKMNKDGSEPVVKRKRGRPRNEDRLHIKKPAKKQKHSKKLEDGKAVVRKRKLVADTKLKDGVSPPLKKPKISDNNCNINGDIKIPVDSIHKSLMQKGQSDVSDVINSNGTFHCKKPVMFGNKKSPLNILKSASFHPPPSSKKELLNGNSSLSSVKFQLPKSKNAFKRDLEVNSIPEMNSRVVNSVSLPSKDKKEVVSNDFERYNQKFPSKEAPKLKEPLKTTSKECAKYQTKDLSKLQSKPETVKFQAKESSRPQLKDSAKSQLNKSQVKVNSKEPVTKEVNRPQAKDTAKSQIKETVKSQPKDLPKPLFREPVKSHPQRMASLDAMAKMHVICTTDRKPPEPKHTSLAVCSPRPFSHQKSITHERIQLDVKKETNEFKGNIVHKQEINFVKEKQQVFVSHSLEQSSFVEHEQSSFVEHEQSKTVSTKVQHEKEKKRPKPAEKSTNSSKKVVKNKVKPSIRPKLMDRLPKSEKAKSKALKTKDDDKKIVKSQGKAIASKVAKTAKEKCEGKKVKKVEQTKSEVKVKETIRMQKTCTYQSVTTVNSHGTANSGGVPVSHVGMTTNYSKTKKTVVTDEECKNKVNFSTGSVINNSYCLTNESPCSVGPHTDCCKFHAHPQMIPVAHVQTCSLGHGLGRTSDPSASSSSSAHCDASFPMHRFGHQQPVIFSPPDCGCCCPNSLVQNVHDSCLLRKSLVTYPHHLASHHSHLSPSTFSPDTVCAECRPGNPALDHPQRHHYTLSSPTHSRVTCCACCELHRESNQSSLHFVSQPPKTSSSLVPCEQSPLDLSLTSSASTLSIDSDISLPQGHCSGPLCCRDLFLLRTAHRGFQHSTLSSPSNTAAAKSCCKCSAATKQRTCEAQAVESGIPSSVSCSTNKSIIKLSKPPPHAITLLSTSPAVQGSVPPIASTSGIANKIVPRIVTDDSVVSAKREKIVSPKQSSKLSVIAKKCIFAHGWSWKGRPKEKCVALTNDSVPCPRVCYPSVQHKEGDTISERDCVLLRSGPKDTDLPYVAKVAAFWENPDDGEMMMSLLWYYRPEHTEQGRKAGQMEDEVFASRHKDVNSVACIEDKCYVLTYSEYCRYKASMSMDDDMISQSSVVVPELPDGYPRKNRLPCEPVSQDIVFFCRHVYDFRQKRILKNPT